MNHSHDGCTTHDALTFVTRLAPTSPSKPLLSDRLFATLVALMLAATVLLTVLKNERAAAAAPKPPTPNPIYVTVPPPPSAAASWEPQPPVVATPSRSAEPDVRPKPAGRGRKPVSSGREKKAKYAAETARTLAVLRQAQLETPFPQAR
jgi:hypothetical protein